MGHGKISHDLLQRVEAVSGYDKSLTAGAGLHVILGITLERRPVKSYLVNSVDDSLSTKMPKVMCLFEDGSAFFQRWFLKEGGIDWLQL